MRRMILLISIFLLTGTWVMAQYGGGQYGGDNGGQRDQSGYGEHRDNGGAHQVSLEGCLYGENGNFVLTDQAGNTFELTGRTEGFGRFVDHTVRLTGRTRFDENRPYAMSGNEEMPTLHVFRVEHVSHRFCGEGGY